MYTQCPDCSTAFRVTAEILKQAAGKVRCGGCGNAFNALEYLSESMPERAASTKRGEAVPELKPEPLDGDAPKTISAEQSAALLKTLDELAGSDIRIEDTGVEWRVLDEDEIGDAADDEMAIDAPLQDQPDIDELLDESPTPVDQFLTKTPPVVDAPEIFEETAGTQARSPVDELRFDDNTPLPDDFDLDDEYTPPPADEPDADDEPEVVAEEEAQLDVELSDPGEWTDILDEFEQLADDAAEPTIADELEALEADADDEADTADDSDEIDTADAEDVLLAEADDEPEVAAGVPDEPLDMDTQFAMQAEAMGIDLSGVHEAPEIGSAPEVQEDLDLDAMIEETQRRKVDIDDLLDEELVDDGTVGDLDFDGDDEAAGEDPGDDDESTQLELIDVDVEEDLDDEFADEPVLAVEDDDESSSEHVVPPMSEEEQTINMQIDQDLLAIAVEDEDGFASTIVIPDGATEEKARAEKSGEREDDIDPDFEQAMRDSSAGFETIIMEGEHIRRALEEDSREADREAAAASLAGAAAAREADGSARGGVPRWGMIAGIAALALVLVLQVLHQSRESLATIPAFNSVAGPMYRALGKPLSPEWDITGWRFEVTRGSADEGNENLTIYSRLGNTSEKPLPYPLIGISLTDRFEETIGSRVLDPADYLPSDLDPRQLVEPGNTFNAVITIPSPAEDATGFKLNVCYRESGGNLRCAIDDFR